MDKETAYNLGRDCGKNGANTTNSNFKIFSQPEFTKEWSRGRDDALKRKNADLLMVLRFQTKQEVEDDIEECEGEHIQQVVFSTHHKALTQICFGCGIVRTSLKKELLK